MKVFLSISIPIWFPWWGASYVPYLLFPYYNEWSDTYGITEILVTYKSEEVIFINSTPKGVELYQLLYIIQNHLFNSVW